MKKLGGMLAVALVAGGAFYAGRRFPSSRSPAAGQGGRKILYYVDPMHPAYKSDQPGIAPDCGMKLEPVYADGGAAVEAPRGRILYYRDPKQPDYRSDKPGLNPETGNDLEPVYETPPPGSVRIPEEKLAWIGVRTLAVEREAPWYSFRGLGKVAIDERRIARVQARAEGWIERVLVDFTGERVQKGQPMLTLYSPELVASQQEFLLARKSREALRASTLASALEDSRWLIEAARRRLEHWNLTPEQIQEVERTGKPIRAITLYAPAAGHVIARNAFPGQRVSPETELYTLADLSRVWIVADVFESDSGLVREGQSAVVSLSQAGGRRFPARVSYIYPQFEPTTRTLKVRLEADNPALALKPEMFVDVEFRAGLGARLFVPADAVLDGGTSKTLFVAREDGYFEPRAVETGLRVGDRVEILKGLKAGERIAATGAFLLDSESKLRAPAEPAGEHRHD